MEIHTGWDEVGPLNPGLKQTAQRAGGALRKEQGTEGGRQRRKPCFKSSDF